MIQTNVITGFYDKNKVPLHERGWYSGKINRKLVQTSLHHHRGDRHPKYKCLLFLHMKHGQQRWVFEEDFEKESKKLTEKHKKDSSVYRMKNPKRVKELKHKYYMENKLKVRTSINKYRRKKFKTDPSFKIEFLLRTRIRDCLKKQAGIKAKKSLELLGCTSKQARDHLESQFTEGMTWDNMGRGGWHIDHIIPCAFFDLTKPSHQKVCFNWQNLQPLWEKDNCVKGDKIPLFVLLTILKYNYKTITL